MSSAHTFIENTGYIGSDEKDGCHGNKEAMETMEMAIATKINNRGVYIMHQPVLVPFYCKKCGRKLVEALPSSTVYCPKCHVGNIARVINKKVS